MPEIVESDRGEAGPDKQRLEESVDDVLRQGEGNLPYDGSW